MPISTGNSKLYGILLSMDSRYGVPGTIIGEYVVVMGRLRIWLWIWVMVNEWSSRYRVGVVDIWYWVNGGIVGGVGYRV